MVQSKLAKASHSFAGVRGLKYSTVQADCRHWDVALLRGGAWIEINMLKYEKRAGRKVALLRGGAWIEIFEQIVQGLGPTSSHSFAGVRGLK